MTAANDRWLTKLGAPQHGLTRRSGVGIRVEPQPLAVVQRQAAGTDLLVGKGDPGCSIVWVSRGPDAACAEQRTRPAIGPDAVVGHRRRLSCRSIQLLASSGSTSRANAISIAKSERASVTNGPAPCERYATASPTASSRPDVK